MGLGLAAAARRLDGLDAGGGLPQLELARLQRGDDPLHPGARLADASRSTRPPGANGRRPTTGARSTDRSTSTSRRSSATSTRTSGSTSAASRTRTCAMRGIDYFENSRRATLLAARVRDRESGRLRGLRRGRLGADRLRRPARRRAHGPGAQARSSRATPRAARRSRTSSTTARSPRPRRPPRCPSRPRSPCRPFGR